MNFVTIFTRESSSVHRGLVLTRLDYGNGVLAGLPLYLVRRASSVLLNAAARLTYHLRRSDHITDALVCLHRMAARD